MCNWLGIVNQSNKKDIIKQTYVLSGMLLQDENANRSEKESPASPQQAAHALPPVHR